jgi:hypothetical protein
MRTNAGVRIAFASYPAALILFGTLRVFCGRKKLPFAGYSIVKEPKGIGEYRARTGDLLVANQALSQLS